MPRLACLALACLLSVATSVAAGASASPHPAQADLEAFLHARQVLSATFRQVEDGVETSGRVWMGPGGKLRWEQRQPHPLTVVSNGRVGWQVDPDLNQAVRLDPAQMEGWASLFQAGSDRLERVDARTWRTPQAPGKPRVVIAMGAAGPSSVEVDGRVSTHFGTWEPDSTPPAFTYAPPPGMDVFGR